MGETVLKQLTNETNRMLDQVIRDLRRLPYDAEIEYLESTGTQWIDTGVVPTQITKIRFAYLLTQTPTDSFAAAFGCMGATGGATTSENAYSGFTLFNNPTVPIQARVGRSTAANIVSDVSVAANVRYDGELQFGQMRLNGTEYTQSGSGSWITMTRTICTHAANDDSSTFSRRFVQARFFSFSIYDGSTLVRDFIPVRLGTTGYLYDKVSGQLFGNAGAGEFVLGPDKKTTRDYVQDGLVAMWDGIENTREREHDPNATVWTDLINSYILSATAATDTWGSDHLQIGTTTWPIQASQKAAFISTINNVQNVGGQATIEMVLSHTNQSNKCIFGQMFRSFDIHSLGVREQVWFKNGSDINVGPTAGGLHSITITGERVGSTSNQYNTWYYNGENESSATRVFNTNSNIDPQALGIGLGQYPSRGISTANIYSIRVYNRVLSAEEVAANFAIDKARFKIS